MIEIRGNPGVFHPNNDDAIITPKVAPDKVVLHVEDVQNERFWMDITLTQWQIQKWMEEMNDPAL